MSVLESGWAVVKDTFNVSISNPIDAVIFCLCLLAILVIGFIPCFRLGLRLIRRTRDRSETTTETIKGVGYEPDVRL